MAIRPPQGDSGTEEAVEFGIAALNARLDESSVEFPATTSQILSAIEDTEVPSDASGHTLDLREALADVEADRFETETELLDVLHPRFEAHRKRAADSLVARLRALLPV